jgi:hypothetical protein
MFGRALTGDLESAGKNKVQNGGIFFGHEKVTINRPALPRISPQNHHKKTTI